MFSKSLKKEVARFLVCVMMLTNISPAFTMLPEYDIRVERQVRLNPVTQMEEVGFTVLAQKLVESTYQTIVNQFITPFMLLATIAQQSGWYQQTEKKKQRQEESEKSPQLYEILEKVKAEVKEEAIMAPSSFSIAPKPLETELSRGFCLAIPELGDLLISHEGDVVFDNKAKKIDKTLKISAPSQVILNNTSAKNIEVEATAAFLTGKSKVSIESLKFRGKSETDQLVNSLFIDKEAELSVSSLVLEDALLLNAGKLSVANEMDLSGGYMFNVGTLTTSADPSVLQNIAYLFNGSTGQINAAGRMLLETNRFANLGHMRANSLSIVTADSFNNEGTIETTRKFELSILGRGANSGIIDGKSGNISISGTKFEHARGRISSSKTDFRTEETEIGSEVVGQEGSFHGKTTVNGNIHLQHGIIEGTFTNSSEKTTFEKTLTLTGEKAEILNDGKIITERIISDSTEGKISKKYPHSWLRPKKAKKSNEITATEILSRKDLSINYIDMPNLMSVVTLEGAKLQLSSGRNTLNQILNAGDTELCGSFPELESIRNTSTGNLSLESSSPLKKITSLDSLAGKVRIKADFPNITNLILQNNATLELSAGGYLGELRDIEVREGATLVGYGFFGLKEIRNFGTMTIGSELRDMQSIYNASNATLHFLSQIRINGYLASRKHRQLVSELEKQHHLRNVALFNEGEIFLDIPKWCRFQSYDLDIWGCYAASENAILHHGDCTHIKAHDYFNDGIIYSKNKHSVNAHSKVTKWGMIKSEDDIIFDALSPKAAEISDTFTPIIDDTSKKVTIKSKDGIKITSSISWNVNLNVTAPSFEANEDIAVRRFDAKTDSFSFGREKTHSDMERKRLSTHEGINIDTKEFINRSGKIESLGDIRIKVDGTFINTGGGFQITDPDKKPQLEIYNVNKPQYSEATCSKVATKPYEGEYWMLREENAGCITTGSILEIIAKKFDNSFGILNAAKRLQIESKEEVLNRSGLIYSGGAATIKGTLLDNGYLRSNLPPIHDYDPNEPIRGNYTHPYQVWIPGGYMKHNGMWPFGSDEWIDTSHYGTRYEIRDGIIGYKPRTQYFNASDRHGYIFTNDDLDIFMSGDLFFGRIVSARNVRINGKEQQTNNGKDRGEIIVGGNVDLEYQKLSLAYTAIQAQDVQLKTCADLQIHGIIVPTHKQNGETAYVINAEKLAADLGFMITPSAFALSKAESDTDAENNTPSALVPTTLSSHTGLAPLDFHLSDRSLKFYPTDQAGFIGLRPNVPFFISTIPNNLITRLLVLTLAPIYGRSVLTNRDLLTSLIEQGHRIEADFGGDHSIVLREKESPALMFEKSNHPEIEVDIDGEKTMIPLYKPYIFMDRISRIITEINAKIATIVAKNVDIHPGPLPIKAPTTNIKALEKLNMKGSFSPTRNNVNPVSFPPEVKDLNLSGDHGIETEGVDLSLSGNLLMESKHGSIIDRSMPLDPEYTHSWHDVSMRRRTFTSSFQAASTFLTAPEGSISHEGTNLVSGGSGTTIHSKTYTWTPAYEDYGFYHSDSSGYAKTDLHTPKAGGLQSLGKITFASTDTTLIGAHIVANTISNPVDGTFRTIPAYAKQTSESYTVSRGDPLGLGESTRHVQETREMVRPTYQISEHFESLGVGTYEMESTVMRALDATITKNLVERTAFDRITTRITDTSRGICAPKIKGDPLFEAMRGLESIRGDGDTLPTVFNLVSAGAQAGTHALTLANLAKNPDPFSAVTSILLNRFVSGPVISHTKTVTERKESIPHQSDVNVGILRIDNSRTHLEGVWNVTDRGHQSHIRTSEFTTDAPHRTVEQTSHTTGWSVALSPAALVGVGLGFEGATLAGTLPSVSLHKADSETFFGSPRPMTFTADDLLITCDNAVIRGSKIHARLLEMIVSGDLTIESLKEEFRLETHSASIGTKLDALHAFVTNSTPISGLGDSRLGVVPTMRFVDEEILSEKVREVAQLVGQEKFYLTVGRLLHKIGATVGLQPDGVVMSDDAERINAGQILEEKVREAEHHERHVFNPSVAELCGMMAEVDAFKQLRAKIELQQMKEGVPVEEREKTQKEIDEFLKKTEVMEKIKKTNEIKQEKAKIKQKIKNLEIDEIELAEHFQDDISSSAERKIPTLSKEETFLTKVRSQLMYYREQEEFLKRSLLDTIYEMQVLWDNYIADHPKINMWIEKIKEHSPYIIDALFYTSVAIEVFGTGGAAIPLATAQLALRKGGIKLVTKLGKLGLEKAVRKKTIKEVTKTLIRSEAFNEGVITLNYLAANEAKDCGRTPEEKRKYIEMTTRASAAIQGLNQTKTLVSSIKSIKRSSNFLFNKKVNWNETSNAKRGLEFKQAIQKSLPSSFEKDPTKGIDAFDRQSGHALSIMTLDTRSTSRISDPKSISRIINRRAKEISSITSVENAPIRSKEIFIGIPKSTTSEQLSHIEESRKFTESLGIILTVSVEE